MTPILRKILVFCLEFVPLFLVFMWLYLLVLPYYQPAQYSFPPVALYEMYRPNFVIGV